MAGVCSTSGRSCPLLGYPSRGWTQHMLSVTASVHTPFVPRVTLQRPSQSPADYNLHCLQGSHRCILVWSSEANQQLVTEQQVHISSAVGVCQVPCNLYAQANALKAPDAYKMLTLPLILMYLLSCASCRACRRPLPPHQRLQTLR